MILILKFAKQVVSIAHGTTVLCIYIVFETAKILLWASAPIRKSRFRVWKRHDTAAILSLIFSYHKFTKHVVGCAEAVRRGLRHV